MADLCCNGEAEPALTGVLAQDPEAFVEDGGWNFLDQEGGSDAEGEEDESEGDGPCSAPVLRPTPECMAVDYRSA